MRKVSFFKYAMKISIILLILSVMWSCSFFGDRKKDHYIPVEFDLQNEVGPFNGLGANVPLSFYSRRMKVLQTFNELGIKYIRVKREDENWDDILALRASTSRLGIKWIYSLDAIPGEFLDDYGKLADVKGFAGWWAEEVDELLYQDVPADYIELLDTPDILRGDSLALTSDLFNELIHATRTELDLRDFQNVDIVGPGLSSPAFGGDLETWYMDLDQAGFDILPFWTVHSWGNRLEGGMVGNALGNFFEYLERIESRKPLLVNSFATSETKFNDIQYPDPNQYDLLGNLNTFETYYYSATFTLPYALRVYSNTLDLLKNKEVVPFLYQLYDAPADVKYKKRSWGLLDLNGGEKPIFSLLSQLMKRVPKQSTIISTLDPTQDGLNAMTFKNSDEVLVTVINEGLEPKSIQVSLRGIGRKLEIKSAEIHFALNIFPPEQGKKDIIGTEEQELKLRSDGANDSYVFALMLKPQSIFVGEFQYK
ncbi:MAG: hypothetical protein HOB84_01610 [Candidatus Marinimicrobia bacterium]|nr:hypothetical protein [Candidatus Neomarinimicrobiota bacterium]MBT4944620.1 hypothetical protein [Candidatus Neomarinimicrobiota bacterium]MBT5270682.1 hypothetical protein [Candidatus Neomarinimicrobiota bacterium]MBT6010091.1 hypothetical protein [Candidatus Neomarinimicrobiota bacterium]